MSNPEDKSMKYNGLDTDPLQRLPSFKAPRDLTLGANKPNKKVFTPNLNVTRNKNKGPTLNISRDPKKDDKGRRDRKNDRKNFRNGPNIIKSGGVFSEGLGSSERHYNRTSYGRDSESAAALQKPTIRVKDVIKIDKELEEQKIKSVVGDSNYDDDSSVDFKRVIEKDAPVKLPMGDGGWLQNQTKSTVKVKQEVAIKSEPGDDVDCAMAIEDKKPFVDIKQEVFENTDVVNLLKSDQPTLILLQLPDTLPGRGGSMEDNAPRRKQTDQPCTSTGESKEEKPVDNRCRLADLEEGRIGKLRVHRSGRVSLALGDTIFEVYSGTKPAFYQEVVSVAVDDASRSANMVALGPLQHKLNLVPNWESMFQDLPK
ncbi:DNA-directed RNA polymerase III subunit RPC4 isoform X2 [Galleria mellonella]|uniref:DNA-directed RNA polymerase III subunit RPC4 isoform X2 n=1 Tax=Galleria mellonella TaxID=7137 RepID=A0ABM3MZ72_GALME|nr:DNA-directed RNA polymerase III subunit RPC4 isoform X2 [Galleria mellonella]